MDGRRRRTAGFVDHYLYPWHADRHVVGQVKRTQDRPLATGQIKHRDALLLFTGLCMAAGLLVLFLNRATQLLAVGGLLVAAAYPFMKRWTHLPQVVLGIAFSWGILMAWTATDQGLTNTAGVMFVGSLLWIVAYDTMYAMVDRDDDLKVGIKSTAILFGDLDRIMIGILQISALVSFLLAGLQLGYQHFYYVGLLVCSALFGYQQYLIRNREKDGCFAAFKNNINAGFALFIGTVLELAIHQPGL